MPSSTAPPSAPPSDSGRPENPPPPAPAQSSSTLWLFIAALMGVVALAELAFIIVNVSALPVYLKFGLGLPQLVGLSMGAFYVAEAAGNPLMGGLSDRFGRRVMMMLGSLTSLVTCLCTAGIAYLDANAHARGIPHTGLMLGGIVAAILFLRVLDGTAAAMIWPAVYASVGDRVDEKRQGQALSVLNITYLLGIAVGPAIGGWANDSLGGAFAQSDARRYVPSFLLGACCFVVSAILAFLFAPQKARTPLPEQQRHTEEAHEDTVGEISVAAHPPVGVEVLRRALRRVPALMLLGFLVFSGVGLITPFAKPYCMERFGLSEFRFGALLLWPALIIAASAPFVGKLTDAWGKVMSIRLGLGLCAAALWMILLFKGELTVVFLGSLLGLGFVLSFPAYVAYANDSSEPAERGGTIGAVRMAQGIGAFSGALLASPLYGLDPSYMVLFITAGSLVAMGFLLSLFFIREPSKPTKQA